MKMKRRTIKVNGEEYPVFATNTNTIRPPEPHGPRPVIPPGTPPGERQAALTKACVESDRERDRLWAEWQAERERHTARVLTIETTTALFQGGFLLCDAGPDFAANDRELTANNVAEIHFGQPGYPHKPQVVFANGRTVDAVLAPSELDDARRTANLLQLASEELARPPLSNHERINKRRAGEITEAQIKSTATVEDAVRMLQSAFPDLATDELHAGMMHIKGSTWQAMTEKTRLSKAALSRKLARFYAVTEFPRIDRRAGMGKKYQIDERRDAAGEHSEHSEHSDE